jgi:DNA-binding SARP family transcriptional activator
LAEKIRFVNAWTFKNIMIKRYLWLYILFSFLCSNSTSVLGQTYGLKFQGQNVTLDHRTELNLTPDGFLKFQDEFEISFDYKIERIIPNATFGYVFRIINSENYNVDLLSAPSPVLRLNVVAGKNNSYIPVVFPENLVGKWIKLRIKFLLRDDKLIFYTPDSFYVSEGIGFNKKDEFKIIFGANDFNQFKTTDVPSMSIKNLQISENGVLKYAWHLDETEGFITIDRINRQEAHVKNPVWLKLTHQVWQTEFEKEADGPVMVAFDENNERIFIVGTDELWIYSAEGNTIEQIKYNKKVNFNPNTYCAIFNSSDNKIYCYIVDSESVYTIDIVSGEWNQHEIASQMETKYRHHNRFYRQSNNSIYLFGGYGFHKYSNEIRKIDLASMSVSNLPSNIDVFYPRYLAGLGELNDTVYILGGYGSTTGDQLINPHSYYDLFGYSLENGELFKKFEIPRIIDDMALANTLWIDPEKRNYYALIFGKSKFDGHLQLVKGNLDAPKIETVGNKIPFQFLDIRSFSSLFYFPVQKKLFAYTSYLSENNKARVSLYSISYPPDNFSINDSGNKAIGSQIAYSLIFFILLLSGVVIFIYRRRKRRKPSDLIQEPKIPDENSPGNDLSTSLIDKNKYHIILFGGFQVYNKNFKDITSNFSPLLKELFLLIFLYSFKNNKGISSEKITEILWFDKSEKSARNNRAVNIAKLKGLLEEIGSCELSKKTGYWKISFEDTQINSDYFDFLSITSSKKNLTKQKVIQLIEISQKGGFLVNAHYEWLDEFKAQVADTIMDTLVEYGHKADIKAEAEFIINLADCIFNFDIVNEEAMILKCKAQYCMGKHSHSKATYEKFFKEYSTMYNQEYDKAFTEIINLKE